MENDAPIFGEHFSPGVRHEAAEGTLEACDPRPGWDDEFVALGLKDIDLRPDGTGQALIPRGRTEAEGEGRRAYFSRETVRWLKVWLEHAKIIEGNFDPLNDQEILHGARIPTAVNACETYCLVKRAP